MRWLIVDADIAERPALAEHCIDRCTPKVFVLTDLMDGVGISERTQWRGLALLAAKTDYADGLISNSMPGGNAQMSQIALEDKVTALPR